MKKLLIPYTLIVLLAVLVVLNVCKANTDTLAGDRHKSVPEYTEGQVRVFAQITVDCVSEFVYTHPGQPTDFVWLTEPNGPCDPLGSNPLTEKE